MVLRPSTRPDLCPQKHGTLSETHSFSQRRTLEGRGKWGFMRPKPEARVGVETAGPWKTLGESLSKRGSDPTSWPPALIQASPQVILAGISAVVLSRYLPSTPLRWTVFSLSVACALLSLICALGLLASIAVTFATKGRALLAPCTFENTELPTLAPDCPFDPTRIYSSSLCLWAISLIFCLAESMSAVRCAQLVHRLLELRPWWGKSCHHSIQASPEPLDGHDLLSCTS